VPWASHDQQYGMPVVPMVFSHQALQGKYIPINQKNIDSMARAETVSTRNAGKHEGLPDFQFSKCSSS
jgi:hypothetical protein